MKRSCRGLSVLVLSLAGAGMLPAVALAQAATGPCKPVFDAMLKETVTPHHTVTIQNGSQPIESISTADAMYVQVKGEWRRSPMKPESLLAQQQENIRSVTVASCTALADEFVDGRRAAVYQAHYEQPDLGASDAKVWIAKATGLPIRTDVSVQAGEKTSVSTRFDYDNIKAPLVK
jgi:hypothetical protein